MKTRIADKKLVDWLLRQGATKLVSYDFVLEKGMGERMLLVILDAATVELTWFGRPISRRG